MPCLALGKPLPCSNAQAADFLVRITETPTNLLYDSGQHHTIQSAVGRDLICLQGQTSLNLQCMEIVERDCRKFYTFINIDRLTENFNVEMSDSDYF